MLLKPPVYHKVISLEDRLFLPKYSVSLFKEQDYETDQ